MADCRAELPPLGGFEGKLFAALRRKPVEPGFAIVFRLPVLSENESLPQQALQGRIERSVSYLQYFVRSALNGLRNGVAVGATGSEGLQNEQVEGALKEVHMAGRLSSRVSTSRINRLRSSVKGNDRCGGADGNLKLKQSMEYRRILVRATNWVGDAVMSVPALQALRERYPAAQISILARPWVAGLYGREPFCDELIPYDAPRGWKGIGEKRRVAAELRKRRFDAAILLQNAFEAAALVRWAGIPVRIGYARRRARVAADASYSRADAWRNAAASTFLLSRAAEARAAD